LVITIMIKEIIKKALSYRFDMMPDRYRYGNNIFEYYQLYMASQWWSRDELEKYQWDLIQKLIHHAYNNTKYYRRKFDEVGIKPEDIRSKSDFRNIPYLTRDEIKANFEDLKSKDFDSYNPMETRTGGSTGSPLILYRSKNSDDVRAAMHWRSYFYGGQDYRDRKMIACTRYISDNSQSSWSANYRNRSLTVIVNQLDEERLNLFINFHRKFNPRIVTGFLEFYRVLSNYIKSHNITDIKPGAIFPRGETITDIDRKSFEDNFGCKIFDYYGMRENAVSANECLMGNMHINSEFTYIEFENDRNQAKPGEHANIIGTNLHNYAFPLLRYATGDMGYCSDKTCSCGRKHQIMKIIGGRDRDYLRIENKFIAMTHHIAQLLNLNISIKKIQFYQPDIKHLIIRIVRGNKFTLDHEAAIISKLTELTQGELVISTEYVDDIPRTKLGKFRYVISDIPNEF